MVSVVIPLFNKGAYVRRALDSVFAQTFQEFEVIVVDDGSTDDGPEQVRAYEDSRLRLIQQPNSGPGAARNRGVRDSKCEYIAFLDADDEWLPDYLRISFESIKLNTDCDLTVSGWYQDYPKSSSCGGHVNIVDINERIFRKKIGGIWKIKSPVEDQVLINITKLFHTNTVLVKKKVLDRYGGFLVDCNYGEDVYLWLILIFNHSFYYIDSPLAWYHESNSNLAGGFWMRPLHGFFLYHKKLFCHIEKINKKLFKKWIALKSLEEAHNRLSVGKVEDVKFLINNFPLMKKVNLWSYTKLIIKYTVPALRRTKI